MSDSVVTSEDQLRAPGDWYARNGVIYVLSDDGVSDELAFIDPVMHPNYVEVAVQIVTKRNEMYHNGGNLPSST